MTGSGLHPPTRQTRQVTDELPRKLNQVRVTSSNSHLPSHLSSPRPMWFAFLLLILFLISTTDTVRLYNNLPFMFWPSRTRPLLAQLLAGLRPYDSGSLRGQRGCLLAYIMPSSWTVAIEDGPLPQAAILSLSIKSIDLPHLPCFFLLLLNIILHFNPDH